MCNLLVKQYASKYQSFANFNLLEIWFYFYFDFFYFYKLANAKALKCSTGFENKFGLIFKRSKVEKIIVSCR